MLKYSFILLFILSGTFSFAQKSLFFINKKQNLTIEVREGQMLTARYKGYMGQTEYAKNIITEINDSFIVLGTDPSELGDFAQMLQEKKSLNGGNSYKIIRVQDLTGFRKMTIARVITKSIFSVATVVGSYFLLTELYQNNNISTGNAFLISATAGIAGNVLVNAIFPEGIKHRLDNSWEVVVASPSP